MNAITLSMVGAACLTSTLAAQTTWHVDDDACPLPGSGSEMDPFCSIQTAIDAAEHGDEIVVAPGVYLEAVDFLGKAVNLHSAAGAAVTTTSYADRAIERRSRLRIRFISRPGASTGWDGPRPQNRPARRRSR